MSTRSGKNYTKGVMASKEKDNSGVNQSFLKKGGSIERRERGVRGNNWRQRPGRE
jgi:hypothetical protein